MADWRRTPPATRTMFWAEAPQTSSSGFPGSSSRISSAKKSAAFLALNKDEPIAKHSTAYHGVGVSIKKHHGVSGTFSLGENMLKWAGSRFDQHSVREILGEVKDCGNKDEHANWTVLIPLHMIMGISMPGESDSESIFITVDDTSIYKFSFRTVSDAQSARSRLNIAVLNNSEGRDASTSSILSSSTFDSFRTTGRRSRRSIAFEPILQEAEENEEHCVTDETGVDENMMPEHMNYRFQQKEMSKAEVFSAKRSQSSRMEELTDNELIRQWARIYASKDQSNAEIAIAARNISERFRYPLDVEPNVPLKPVLRSVAEQRALEKAEIGRILPMIREMKETADIERIKVESETEVTIISPKKNSRCFKYLCKVSGEQISPVSFERRYRSKILKWEENSADTEDAVTTKNDAVPDHVSAVSNCELDKAVILPDSVETDQGDDHMVVVEPLLASAIRVLPDPAQGALMDAPHLEDNRHSTENIDAVAANNENKAAMASPPISVVLGSPLPLTMRTGSFAPDTSSVHVEAPTNLIHALNGIQGTVDDHHVPVVASSTTFVETFDVPESNENDRVPVIVTASLLATSIADGSVSAVDERCEASENLDESKSYAKDDSNEASSTIENTTPLIEAQATPSIFTTTLLLLETPGKEVETRNDVAQLFAEALRLEEDQLHSAFDQALGHFIKRRRELEVQFGIVGRNVTQDTPTSEEEAE